jgi:hypothetical protein
VVDQTAIETAAEDLEIRYDLHRQVALRGPLGETEDAWIVVAFAASLDDALVACLREVIYWLPLAAGLTGPEAYALASMAVSFRVTQYANQTGSAYTSARPRPFTQSSPRASSRPTSGPGSRRGCGHDPVGGRPAGHPGGHHPRGRRGQPA